MVSTVTSVPFSHAPKKLKREMRVPVLHYPQFFVANTAAHKMLKEVYEESGFDMDDFYNLG